MKLALHFASKLYGIAVSVRNWGYDRGIFGTFNSPLPVVCIGNLTAGGSGKTPLTLTIAQELIDRGIRPVILSRGYGGSERGPRLVRKEDSVELVGDEPLMMARRGVCPVLVCRDRVLGADFIAKSELGEIILLDDGFQHRRLGRRLDLVAIDVSSKRAISNFLTANLLPSGRFRESREQGIKRAGAVILNARTLRALAPDPVEVLQQIPEGLPVFKSFVEIESVTELKTGAALEGGVTVRPLCALGNPDGFLATVGALGNPVGPAVVKPDHAAFSSAELLSYHEVSPGSVFVCSEKDATKLPLNTSVPIYILKIRNIIEKLSDLIELVLSASKSP